MAFPFMLAQIVSPIESPSADFARIGAGSFMDSLDVSPEAMFAAEFLCPLGAFWPLASQVVARFCSGGVELVSQN